VDLLQLHHPNPSIPIEETMGTLADLVRAGKVRYVGVSNFSVTQMQEAQKALGKYPLVSNQVRYNLIDRTIEKEILPYCHAKDITVIAYTPLGRGLDRIRDCDPHGILCRLSRETGKTAAQIVLNWCLCKERVVVIPMSNSAEHLLENCGASGWCLSDEQLSQLDNGIQYRHRTRFDMLARRYLPARAQTLALKAAKWLPRDFRRRFT
jgi:diketogulonate reductase-like aldo/keto reductase